MDYVCPSVFMQDGLEGFVAVVQGLEPIIWIIGTSLTRWVDSELSKFTAKPTRLIVTLALLRPLQHIRRREGLDGRRRSFEASQGNGMLYLIGFHNICKHRRILYFHPWHIRDEMFETVLNV